MKRRQWSSEQKTKIVLESLRGRPLAEICNQYEISQAQFYQWREQFLACAHRAFDGGKQGREQARLREQNDKLKQIVADLTLELKKSEEELW